MDIELLFFILMIGAFLLCSILFKLPTGISMLVAALVGLVAYCFTEPDQFLQIPRHLVDGSFSFIEPVLTVASAMIFMKVIEACGTLDKLSVFVLEKFRRFPTLLLIAFMIILMFPGMITGSSTTGVVTAGALIAPMLIAIGVPKKNTTAIVAAGAVFGMIAPPINIPVMIICDIVDMPYVGFFLPLLILAVPLAIFTVLFLGRKHIKKIDIEDLKANSNINFKIKDEVNWTVYIPLLVLIFLMVMVNVFPSIMPPLGMPLVFIISTIPALFVGKEVNLLKGFKTGAKNVALRSKEGIKVALPIMGMLLGVGMLIQAMTLNGVRGYIVWNVMRLSAPGFIVNGVKQPYLLYIGAMIFIPLFGAISPFASVSVFGGPIVMATLTAISNEIIVVAGISMLAAMGDFLPPSAIAGQTSARIVGQEKYMPVLKKLIVPIAVSIVYSMVFILLLGNIWV